MSDDILTEIRERKEACTAGWQDIRSEAAIDMAYVSGDPWDDDDKKQRKNRPTIAPEEMGQYFNQVVNHLWANPRGMKFAPVGNGASAAGARFYQNKAREIEYRSHAKIGYTTAASDALHRSYGFVRVTTRFASPRTRNQEIWIDSVPNPDMVSPDPDSKRADSSDMQFCFVEEWTDQREFKRQHKGAKIQNFSEWATQHPDWIQGKKVLRAEYWTISTRLRKLLLVQPPALMQQRMIAPSPTSAVTPIEVFDDEIPHGAQVLRDLRDVDYPQVRMYLTNGLEILHEQDWPGKYIPIVSCYGKVLYVPKGGEVKRVILSMTRFGRAPWKAYCYASSQELEVLSMIPKAPLMAAEGQFAGELGKQVQESMFIPKAFLYYKVLTEATGSQPLPPPQRVDYPAGQHLQALEVVKEGFRRAIQSAMGSNFLPTQALKRNEKSGVALERMEQAASTGTFHFVNNYEDMIRQVGVVLEDLIPHIHDYAGETGVMEADETAKTVPINSDQKDAISTKGDYLVTVSTGPSSDSEREAVQEFTDSLVSNLQMIAAVSGPKAAAAVLARSIRLRNGGPMMDQLADLLEPPEYRTKDDEKPPDPEVMAMQQQMQQMEQKLQQAGQIIQTEQVKAQNQKELKGMEIDFKREEMSFADKKLAVESETKLAVAQLGAKIDRLALFLEERARVGSQAHEQQMGAASAGHDEYMAHLGHRHALEQAQQGVAGQAVLADQGHQQALEQGDQGVAGQLAVQAAAPQPANGAGA